MNIIAIDTIGSTLSVSAQNDLSLTSMEITEKTQHISKMPLTIENTIKLAGFSKHQIDLVCIPEGPGSFTGLRLAWSIAKAIQLGSSCKIATIPPLAAFAQPYTSQPFPIFSVLDAKKNRFYTQVFFAPGKDIKYLQKNASEITQDLRLEEIITKIEKYKEIVLVGPDAFLLKEKLDQAGYTQTTLYVQKQHSSSAQLFLQYYLNSSGFCTLVTDDYAGPLYIRKSDAEEGKSEHNRKVF